jgi:hypothetical protein
MLFRTHLRNAYRRLHVPVPDELFASNISTTAAALIQTEPTGRITPTLDGEETSYFEWLHAGVVEARDVAGAMHQTDRRPAAVTAIRFGFDHACLYVRVDVRSDAATRALDLLAGGRELSLKFVTPPGVRFSVRQSAGRLRGSFWDRRDAEPHWLERGPGGSAVAAGAILEMALPLADLGRGAGGELAFFVAIYDEAGVELERHPAQQPIVLAVPDERFDARHWRV